MLVVCELFFVHATHFAAGGFFLHLALKECLVLPIDVRNLRGETLLLKLVIILVSFPDYSLFVIERLFSLLTLLLLGHLTSE